MFAKRFKELRYELNLNQQDLIDRFNKRFNYNFTRVAISQYENSKRIPEIEALICFSEFFNVSTDYLLGKSDLRNIDEIVNAVNKINSNNELKIDTENLSQDSINQIKQYIELLKLKENNDKGKGSSALENVN
ncbi:MAG: helix-turn-helix domain-containing protein [Peptostreptococcaceae bacterium]